MRLVVTEAEMALAGGESRCGEKGRRQAQNNNARI
jgi:hypothetical protein